MALAVEIEDYRTMTGDEDIPATVLASLLLDAQLEVERYLERFLVNEERTEKLVPDREGWLWPSAVPITAVSTGMRFNGYGIHWGGPFGYSDVISGEPEVETVYTGGYTPANMPRTIKEAICRIVRRWYEAMSPTPDVFDAIPAGATSVKQGDSSITFGPSGFNPASRASVEDLLAPLATWRLSKLGEL